MTKAQLMTALSAERCRADEILLALQLLACHARDTTGNLPPMHEADLRHINRQLARMGKLRADRSSEG